MGRDKADLLYEGRTQLERTLELLAQLNIPASLSIRDGQSLPIRLLLPPARRSAWTGGLALVFGVLFSIFWNSVVGFSSGFFYEFYLTNNYVL